MVKNPPANAGDSGDGGSIPGSGRSPGEGNGNPLQYSCLENPMDQGAWGAIVHRVTKSQTQLKQLSMHACMLSGITVSSLTHTYKDPIGYIQSQSQVPGKEGLALLWRDLGFFGWFFFFFFLTARHGLQDLSSLTRS